MSLTRTLRLIWTWPDLDAVHKSEPRDVLKSSRSSGEARYSFSSRSSSPKSILVDSVGNCCSLDVSSLPDLKSRGRVQTKTMTNLLIQVQQGAPGGVRIDGTGATLAENTIEAVEQDYNGRSSCAYI